MVVCTSFTHMSYYRPRVNKSAFGKTFFAKKAHFLMGVVTFGRRGWLTSVEDFFRYLVKNPMIKPSTRECGAEKNGI